MVTVQRPPLVTRGQKTALRHEEGKGEPEGVTLRVDWNQATFRPSDGPQDGRYRVVEPEVGRFVELGEYNAIDAQYPGLASNLAGSGFWDVRRERAVMVARAEALLEQVVLAMSLAMGVSPEDWTELLRGNNGYGRARLGPFGARVDYEPLGNTDRLDFNATLPGAACGAIGHERMVKLFQYQCRVGAVFTRIDIVMDDYAKVILPAEVQELLQGPYVVTRAQEYMSVHKGKIGTPEVTGSTGYIGSPSSRNRLRVYDKSLESDGQTNTIRWELQCRNESAETLGPLLAEKDWQEVIPGRFVSFIDFRALDKTEVEDRTRLPWYSTLVKNAARANMFAAKALKTLADKAAWLEETVAPTLAAVFAGTGENMAEIRNLIAGGMRRLKPQQKEAVRVWKMAGNGRLSFQG